MDAVFAQVVAGLTRGMLLFLVASGLTVVFGMLRVINFAHGALYMLGAYCTYAVASRSSGTAGLVLALVVVPLGVVALGVALEVLLYRRVYRQEHLNQIVLTYALALIITQLMLLTFGGAPRSLTAPAALRGGVALLGTQVPVYSIVVVAVGAVIAALMWLLLARTTVGWRVRAAVDDPLTAQSLGVNVDLIVTAVFAVGVWLAALAGGLTTPISAVTPGMDVAILIESFAVIIIGGVGSIAGALLAALLVGLTQSLGVLWLPRSASLLVFVLMVVVLVVRPQGLLGRRELILK